MQVRNQYESYPYPRYPLLARLTPVGMHPLDLRIWSSLAGEKAPTNPRLLVAGCGTVQATAFSMMNPQAQVVGIDISETSLRRAKLHALRNGQLRPRFSIGDLEQSASLSKLGSFDYIDCYGVLHHLESPDRGLKNLDNLLADGGLLRLMVYSKRKRFWPEAWRDIARSLDLPSNELGLRELESMARNLAPEHPLKAVFYSYFDPNDIPGAIDLFLHAREKAYELRELLQWIQNQNLSLIAFLGKGAWPQLDVNWFEGVNIHKALSKLSNLELIDVLEKSGEWPGHWTLLLSKKQKSWNQDPALSLNLESELFRNHWCETKSDFRNRWGLSQLGQSHQKILKKLVRPLSFETLEKFFSHETVHETKSLVEDLLREGLIGFSEPKQILDAHAEFGSKEFKNFLAAEGKTKGPSKDSLKGTKPVAGSFRVKNPFSYRAEDDLRVLCKALPEISPAEVLNSLPRPDLGSAQVSKLKKCGVALTSQNYFVARLSGFQADLARLSELEDESENELRLETKANGTGVVEIHNLEGTPGIAEKKLKWNSAPKNWLFDRLQSQGTLQSLRASMALAPEVNLWSVEIT